MLTRLRCSGFKTFDRLDLEFAPLTVMVGPNASGKSNLFDAIQLLSHLATSDVRTAVRQLRGEPLDLFRIVDSEGKRATRMRFEVEVLLDPTVEDPWGETKVLKHTRLRYYVELERGHDEHGNERLLVVDEHAQALGADDLWMKRVLLDHAEARTAFQHARRGPPFLHTVLRDDGKRGFELYQDGASGPTRKRTVFAAGTTVLSSITSSDFLHLFALREEMRRWRLLHLDALALRKTSPFLIDDELLSDGSNLAATLFRIESETRSEVRPHGVIPDIVRDVALSVPEMLGITVEKVDAAREYRIGLTLRNGTIPASVASDGTLRVLALCTLLQDPKHRGVLCFEEPENGVHPGRLKALMRMLGERVTDFGEALEDPLRQLLINSHSPVALSAVLTLAHDRPGLVRVVFVDLVDDLDTVTAVRARKTRVRSVVAGDQLAFDDGEARGVVQLGEVNRFLAHAGAA